MTSGGESVIAREGDVVRIPAGADHQAEALDDTLRDSTCEASSVNRAQFPAAITTPAPGGR